RRLPVVLRLRRGRRRRRPGQRGVQPPLRPVLTPHGGSASDVMATENAAGEACSREGPTGPLICVTPTALLSSALMSEVTRILSAIEQGDPHAAEQLLPLVYDELRRL